MKKYITLKRSLIVMLLMVAAPLSLWAQAQSRSVSGTVRNDSGEPIVGASVMVRGTQTGIATDAQGHYTVPAASGSTLQFIFLGMATQEIPVAGRATIDVVLVPEVVQTDEVVVVGYGTQRRGSITGAVASMRGSEMIKTKNENPQNMLTGKLPGLRVWQRSAEPGDYAANFDIRGYEGGSVLVIIDGIPRSLEDFQRMNASDIEDVSVLKDASAAIYGARSASGVLLVTTRKGRMGQTEVNYNGSYTLQNPSGMPRLSNVYESMTLYNERAKSMDNPYATAFTNADFEAYRNGTRRATDWNDLIFADWAPQTSHNISISGGGERTTYYIGAGYQAQQSFFKSGDNNYNKFNLRANINTEIARGLTLNLNLSGMQDEQNKPNSSTEEIISKYWATGPLLAAYADAEGTMLNYGGLDKQENAVAFMTADVSGYRQYVKRKFMSSAELKYDLGTAWDALQGLTMKGLLSYDYGLNDNELYRKEYSLYDYNETTQGYDEAVFTNSSPSRMRREFYDKTNKLGQLVAEYKRDFGLHAVSALAGWEVQTDKADNFYALRDLAISAPYLFMGTEDGQVGSMDGLNDGGFHEYAMSGAMGRLNYEYDRRYLVEAQFRYDGSSKLAPGHQWMFFPSASIGWVISEEPLFKKWAFSKKVNQLKLRASYGKLGDDNTVYAWMSSYKYPQGINQDNGNYNAMTPGMVVNGVFVNGVGRDNLANENITWATSKTFDVGVDLEMWNGLFGATFDYFDRRRSGIYQQANAEMPSVVGAGAPTMNANSDRQFGMELSLSHRNTVGEFSYRVKGMASITRRMFLNAIQNGNYANAWRKWRDDNLNDRYQGVQFGYVGDGQFANWEEIWNYGLQMGRDVLPGDYKYEDWNGDGIINGEDEHPYAFDQTPWLNYSLTFDATWRNWDISMLWQGSAMGSMVYEEPLRGIFGSNGGGALEFYQDRWRPLDPNADPWNPSTVWIAGDHGFLGYGGSTREPKVNSSFNRVSTAYLRLKSLEIGYTLPNMKALGGMKARVYANAYNLLTFTPLKFVDPEHPSDGLGRMYPLNKTYTVGLSLTF